MILINGGSSGHDYHSTLADLRHMSALAHEDTWVVIDDTHIKDVGNALSTAIQEKLFDESSMKKDYLGFCQPTSWVSTSGASWRSSSTPFWSSIAVAKYTKKALLGSGGTISGTNSKEGWCLESSTAEEDQRVGHRNEQVKSILSLE